ncbi:hypothetical protein [Arthrobacter sp. StoSoilB20]|uniref:hypothetical protein n=1 Tax=Arthrobacter sp. StoSoilB20 TaxID=2830995 RepID=UPI001CC70D4B|nr:hypothetical protein [Arthrobacter sp. StoSoilB20]BCW58515.1 hypothetical protein StoSoilB20_18620 [Arthrobacter sp. StoSoilB20]
MTPSGDSVDERKHWWERHPNLTSGLVGLGVGLLTITAGVYGSNTAAETSVKTTRMQIDAEAQQKQREQREHSYRAYLDSANEYWLAARAIFGKPAPETSQEIQAAFTKFVTARSKFQGQVNEISVYGSDEAWSAHQKVAATLPKSLGLPEGKNFSAEEVADEATFTTAYTNFLAVRCREVVQPSRSGCAD